ncbi:MAG: DUF1778 domain-containing protein [Verrucomicrobiota bacterium]
MSLTKTKASTRPHQRLSSKSAQTSGRANFRITAEAKAMIAHAARVRRTTLSQFMIQSSVDAAQEVLADRTRFVLSPDAWDKFRRLLDAPPKAIPKLAALLKEKSVFER